MGFYINPKDSTKEDWLIKNATLLPFAPLTNVVDDEVVVCLVDNGAFTAAAIAFSQDELAAFSHPDDPRPKLWFAVPASALTPFLYGQEIEGATP